MNFTRLSHIFLIGGTCLIISGCTAIVVCGAVGASSCVYLSGELESTEKASFNQAWNATQTMLKTSGYTVTSIEKDLFYTKFEAKDPGDRKITIKLITQSVDRIKIKVRVGTFGDESLSRKIIEDIRNQIG